MTSHEESYSKIGGNHEKKSGLEGTQEKKILEFEKIFKKFHDDLYGYGMKLCGKRELVEDHIQELFVSLWNRSAPLDEIKSKKSYLLISLRRSILKHLEEQREAPEVKGQWEQFPSFTFTSEEIIIQNEMEENRKSALAEALNQLPARQKEVVYLRFYRGLSYEEIEEMLAINYQSIVNHIHRAIKRLRSILDNYPAGSGRELG